MHSAEQQVLADFNLNSDGNALTCHGYWTIEHIKTLSKKLHTLQESLDKVTSIDMSGIDDFDSAGALMLNKLIRAAAQVNDPNSVIQGLKKRYQALYMLVSSHLTQTVATVQPVKENPLYYLGVWAVDKMRQVMEFVAFIGELVVLAIHAVIKPKLFSWRETLVVMEETGYKALGIIALMSFLIGVVLAYQLAVQLRQYGATIFVVDTTGIAILREFAPLITSVIMAGRTSTAFAALIGTMTVNEEIDALRTMGIQPVQRLVLPRIISLLITLPLLVVWADIFGVLGSMIMAKGMLGISYAGYLNRFDIAVGLTHYNLGLIKAPVFALIIAGVGCFQGFQVGLSAESVGLQTTKAAVQSIFLIIIADAAFSIIFSMVGL